MKIVLNKDQKYKYKLIRKYLNTEIGKEKGLLLSVNDSTNVYSLKKMFMSSIGIFIKGKSYPKGKFITDRLFRSDVTIVYDACVQGDNDFRKFADLENIERKKNSVVILKKGQSEKFILICSYLMTELGKTDGLILDENQSTSIRRAKRLYINETDIYISGFDISDTKKRLARLKRGVDITHVFYAGIRGDGDFKSFVDKKGYKY